MEIENNIFLRRDRLPQGSELAQAIQRHGFALTLPASFDWAADEVTLGVEYRGESVVLEYYANPVDVQELRSEGLLRKGEARKLEDRDFLISLVSHQPAQHEASLIVAAVLCELADGCLAYAGEPPFIFADQAVEWARERLGI